MEIENFSVIEQEFHERVRKIVWCSMATVDRKNRPRSRIMHPMWEGCQGWVGTNRHSHKEKHLKANPHVSLCYWDPDHKQVYADCKAAWVDDSETRNRIWELYKSTPEPYGYDLGNIWSGPDDDEFGLMSLTPWRIELYSIHDPTNNQVWHNHQSQA